MRVRGNMFLIHGQLHMICQSGTVVEYGKNVVHLYRQVYCCSGARKVVSEKGSWVI